jgi:hypothetical protein
VILETREACSRVDRLIAGKADVDPERRQGQRPFQQTPQATVNNDRRYYFMK